MLGRPVDAVVDTSRINGIGGRCTEFSHGGGVDAQRSGGAGGDRGRAALAVVHKASTIVLGPRGTPSFGMVVAVRRVPFGGHMHEVFDRLMRRMSRPRHRQRHEHRDDHLQQTARVCRLRQTRPELSPRVEDCRVESWRDGFRGTLVERDDGGRMRTELPFARTGGREVAGLYAGVSVALEAKTLCVQ